MGRNILVNIKGARSRPWNLPLTLRPEPVLGEGHYVVVLAGASHRTLDDGPRGLQEIAVIGHVNNGGAAGRASAGQANRRR